MRPLLVGECPGPRSPAGTLAFEARRGSGAFLRALLGFPPRSAFECVNLFGEHVERWSAPPARVAAVRVLRRYEGPGPILLAGRRVADAFCVSAAWFEPVEWPVAGVTLYAVPHPSGLSRWWNDEANRDGARVFLRAVAEQGGAAWRPATPTSS